MHTPNHPTFSDIDIIIALGNPGQDYAATYHNAGVHFVQFLAETQGDAPKAIDLLGSFMNESGPSVKKILARNGISAERLLLVHDDVDIPLGQHRFSFGSGAAGHHGVESVIAALGTNRFWRLRIGIAKTIETADGRTIKKKAMDYVLKPIPQTDRAPLLDTFEQAIKELSM